MALISEEDYVNWNSALKQQVESGSVQINFDLPPKSIKSLKAESAVVFLFGQVYNILGMSEIQFFSGFPDCTALWRGTKVNIEFEYDNADFNADHKQKPKPENLLLICWENRWRSCPYPTIELKRIYLR